MTNYIMMTEDYLSFETAKLLKEKGFDGECKRTFRVLKNFGPKVYDFPEWITNEDLCSLYQNCEFATIPTLQMAMKWLREVHNLWCEISWEGKGLWCVDIFSLVNEEFISGSIIHEIKSYEEACESAIRYCLENLI